MHGVQCSIIRDTHWVVGDRERDRDKEIEREKERERGGGEKREKERYEVIVLPWIGHSSIWNPSMVTCSTCLACIAILRVVAMQRALSAVHAHLQISSDRPPDTSILFRPLFFFLVQLCCMRCTHVVFGTHTAVNCWATWPQNDNHDTSWKLSIITADALPPYRTSRSVLGYAPMSSLIAIEALARACTRFYNHNRHRSHSCFVYLARATQFGVPKIELYIR